MGTIGIYKITSPSGKTYIGQSIDIEKRFKTYLRYSCKSQPKLLASLRKYKPENHTYEILCVCEKEMLSEKEKFFVAEYKTFNTPNGLNIRDGGGNRASLSDEQKRKISQTLTGKKHSPERIEANRKGQGKRKLSEGYKQKLAEIIIKQSLRKQARLDYKLTEEQKQKIRLRNTGALNPNFGKPRTQETKDKIANSLRGKVMPLSVKEKISASHLGKKLSIESVQKRTETLKRNGYKPSDETKLKMSEAALGRNMSDETKRKISLAKLGKSNSNLGKQLSEEHKAKLSLARMGRIPWNKGLKYKSHLI